MLGNVREFESITVRLGISNDCPVWYDVEGARQAVMSRYQISEWDV